MDFSLFSFRILLVKFDVVLYVGSINIFYVPLSTLVLKNVLKLSMLNFNQSMSFIPSFIIFFKIKTPKNLKSNRYSHFISFHVF